MISKDATISNGRVIRKAKTTDTIYKGFMLYKAGTNEFEARSNIDNTTYTGSLDDVKNKIDKYWERKDAEEVLKAKSNDEEEINNNEPTPTIGKHNDIPDEDFDPEQLSMGIEVEKEHTDNEDIAKAIAKDHLSEIPNYYTKLKAMESSE